MLKKETRRSKVTLNMWSKINLLLAVRSFISDNNKSLCITDLFFIFIFACFFLLLAVIVLLKKYWTQVKALVAGREEEKIKNFKYSNWLKHLFFLHPLSPQHPPPLFYAENLFPAWIWVDCSVFTTNVLRIPLSVCLEIEVRRIRLIGSFVKCIE